MDILLILIILCTFYIMTKKQIPLFFCSRSGWIFFARMINCGTQAAAKRLKDDE